MRTYQQVLQEGKERLSQAALPEGDWEAWLLFSEAFGMERAQFLLHRDAMVSEEGIQRYTAMIQERLTRRPTAYILGHWGFMGLDFQVNENVLIPRQDTETLVEQMLELAGQIPVSELKVVDLCTGSGCIAISMAHYLGKRARVWATDLSGDALQMAKQNAAVNVVNIEFCQGDLFAALGEDLQGQIDMLLSNPPYIDPEVYAGLEPEVREYEPSMALAADHRGLIFYERIAREAGKWLRPGGYLGLEIGYDQGESVAELLRKNQFEEVRVVQDLTGKDRVVLARSGG